MSASAATVQRLHLRLPESWAVSDPAEWDRGEELAHATGLSAPVDGPSSSNRPDLIATLFQVLTLDGQLIEIVIASLVAWSYASGSLPAAAGERMEGSVIRGMETAPGVRADFYVLTMPVVSEDSSTTTLLTFSTPNLPLSQAMDEAFRSIAATAYVEGVTDSTHQ